MTAKDIQSGIELLAQYLGKKVEIKQTCGDINSGILSIVGKDFIQLSQGGKENAKTLIIFNVGISSLRLVEATKSESNPLPADFVDKMKAKD